MDVDRQKRTSALYLMKMKEVHRLSQVAVDDIVEGSQSAFNHVLHRIRAKVHSKLAAIGIDEGMYFIPIAGVIFLINLYCVDWTDCYYVFV